jgi:hypothetical protein
MQGREAVPLSRLKSHVTEGRASTDWVVAGVVIQKSYLKLSQKVQSYSHARPEVLTAVLLRTQVVWDVLLCWVIVPDVSKNHGSSIFRSSNLRRLHMMQFTTIQLISLCNELRWIISDQS